MGPAPRVATLPYQEETLLESDEERYEESLEGSEDKARGKDGEGDGERDGEGDEEIEADDEQWRARSGHQMLINSSIESG